MISNFEWKCGWFCGSSHAFEGFRLFSFRRTRCKHQVQDTDRLTIVTRIAVFRNLELEYLNYAPKSCWVSSRIRDLDVYVNFWAFECSSSSSSSCLWSRRWWCKEAIRLQNPHKKCRLLDRRTQLLGFAVFSIRNWNFLFFWVFGWVKVAFAEATQIWRKRSRGKIMGWPDLCWFCRWWCVYGRGMERRTSKFIRHPFGSIRMVNSRLSRYHYIR